MQGLARQVQRLYGAGVGQPHKLLIYPNERVEGRERSWGEVHGDLGRGHPTLEVPLQTHESEARMHIEEYPEGGVFCWPKREVALVPEGTESERVQFGPMPFGDAREVEYAGAGGEAADG